LLDVFTQTNPGPPPGAAVRAAAAAAGPCFFAIEIAAGAAAGVGAGIAESGTVAETGAGIATTFAAEVAPGAAAAATYHVCTPLCPRHAPDFEAAIEYDPSPQIPFAPAGAPPAACANALAAPIKNTPAIINIFVMQRSSKVVPFEKR
jgi:hypothetical protein